MSGRQPTTPRELVSDKPTPEAEPLRELPESTPPGVREEAKDILPDWPTKPSIIVHMPGEQVTLSFKTLRECYQATRAFEARIAQRGAPLKVRSGDKRYVFMHVNYVEWE